VPKTVIEHLLEEIRALSARITELEDKVIAAEAEAQAECFFDFKRINCARLLKAPAP
jgi:hypothetical protein